MGGKIAATRPRLNDFRVQRFLEWLVTQPSERYPSTQTELAEELGIDRNLLSQWKNDPDFLAEWERFYRKTVGSPERAKSVLDALHETATDRTDPRQVPAARAYLEAIDAIKPRRVDVTVTKGAAKELSDEELMAMLAERAEAELAARSEDG
jgi:transcriptional regulator with XRE-family HTH domain